MNNIVSQPLPNKGNINVSQLAFMQKLMAAQIMQPLDEGKMQLVRTTNGATDNDHVAHLIKPNDRLTSHQRLEIYNQQYWYRLLDLLLEDFPGLAAILGDDRFEKLATAYLTRYPSHSFLLRNLGDRLEQFISEEPHWALLDRKLVLDMVRFEWAEIIAWDTNVNPILQPESLQDIDPAYLRLELQPYITLLELDYALDEFLLKLNKQQPKTTESNAVIEPAKTKIQPYLPRKEHIYVAVHRLNNAVYYKRLKQHEFLILNALANGKTIGQACEELASAQDDLSSTEVCSKLTENFSTWMELGWFCKASLQ